MNVNRHRTDATRATGTLTPQNVGRHNEHKVHRTDATTQVVSVRSATTGTMNIKCIAQMQLYGHSIGMWVSPTSAQSTLSAFYFAQTTERLEYAQLQVAHDICKHLQAKGIGRLILEENFLSKIAQRHDNEDPESLKRLQKYRQFAAPGKFVSTVKMIAMKYGIAIESRENINLTRMCHYCDHLNPATEAETLTCEGCGREIKQDHNTAINLVRFDDPELAEKALHAGSKK